MAKPQAKVTFLSPINSPAMSSQEQEGYDHVDDYEQEAYSADGFCSCFRLFKWHRIINDNEDQNVLNQNGEPREPSWLVKKIKKLKEVSEVIAGPKWKTFIRKISAYIKKKKKQRYNKNQYNSESYALNFDSTGVDDDLLPDFSSRFAGSSVDEIRRTGL